MNKYVEDQVTVFCQQHSSLPILKLEYTGSVYERLKTEAADEVDVIVVLRTTRREIGVVNPEHLGMFASRQEMTCCSESMQDVKLISTLYTFEMVGFTASLS